MDDHLHPLPAVSVSLGHLILTLDVGFVISEQAIPEGEGGEWQVNTCVTRVICMHVRHACDDMYVCVMCTHLSWLSS